MQIISNSNTLYIFINSNHAIAAQSSSQSAFHTNVLF